MVRRVAISAGCACHLRNDFLPFELNGVRPDCHPTSASPFHRRMRSKRREIVRATPLYVLESVLGAASRSRPRSRPSSSPSPSPSSSSSSSSMTFGNSFQARWPAVEFPGEEVEACRALGCSGEASGEGTVESATGTGGGDGADRGAGS